MKSFIVWRGATLAIAFFLSLILSMPARADSNGVARISLLHGSVTMQRGDSGDIVAASINAPLTAGDYLSTTDNARAEVQFDNATFVRIASDSQIRFTQLELSDHQLQLATGTVELGILHMTDAHPQVQTPSVTVRPDEAGKYRVAVTSDGNTLFTVRSGRADLVTSQGSQMVAAGQSVRVSGTAANPQIQTVATIALDDFDRWNDDRDQYSQSALDTHYANDGIVGLDDLGSYGQWRYDSQYGNVWVPDDEAEDWAPYHDGSWVWEPYWGYTWVSYEPWGWAPYHYGRWFYSPLYGWAWYPGPVDIIPVYSPAYVAFFGFGGSGFNISIGFGNLAWVPLAPFEPFYPWWGPNVAYNNITNITNIINITNITNITNIYKDCDAPNAIAAVTVRDFQRGEFNHHFLPVRTRDLQKVAIVKGQPPIVPTKANLQPVMHPGVAKLDPIAPRFHAFPVELRKPTAARTEISLKTTSQPPTHPVPAPHDQPVPVQGLHAQLPALHAHPQTAWDRFALARGTPRDAEALVPTIPVVQTSSTTTPRSNRPSLSSQPISNAWSSFGSNPGARAPASDSTNVHETPARINETPHQTMVESGLGPVAPWSRFDPDSNPASAAKIRTTKIRTTTESGRSGYQSYQKETVPYSASPSEFRTPYRSSGYGSRTPYVSPWQYAPRSSESYHPTYPSSSGTWSGHANTGRRIENAQPEKPHKG